MIIQRWQSLLLLIATVMMGLFSFLSLGQIQAADYTYNFTALGFTYEGIATGNAATGYAMHTWLLFIMSVMSAILPFITIFLYRNFKSQKNLCLISMLFTVATSAIAANFGYSSDLGGTIGWSSVIVAAPVAFIAEICAYSLIRRDHRIIASSNRLR